MKDRADEKDNSQRNDGACTLPQSIAPLLTLRTDSRLQRRTEIRKTSYSY